ncbi:MAG TPA: GNAT family N-acetyltransferase [Gemmatimonadaceae bacterium]|nr:GNAT family N-acetyltransferase [Gemmatimonadaceae bacterium]
MTSAHGDDAGPPPILRGARVALRPPRPADVEDRLAIGRDPEFRRMVGATGPWPGPLTRAEAERWYETLRREPHGWVVEHAGRCVGVARLHHVERATGRAQLAVGLFAPEHRGRGLGTEVVRLLLAYAFGTLRLSVMRLRVLACNVRAIACYARCGFREVGREPVELDGERAEDLLMEVAAAGWRADDPVVPDDRAR